MLDYPCLSCGHFYKHQRNLARHLAYECGKPAQFLCPHCPYRSKQKATLKRHIRTVHFVDATSRKRSGNVNIQAETNITLNRRLEHVCFQTEAAATLNKRLGNVNFEAETSLTLNKRMVNIPFETENDITIKRRLENVNFSEINNMHLPIIDSTVPLEPLPDIRQLFGSFNVVV